MMRSASVALAIAFASLASASPAAAQLLLTFDDIPDVAAGAAYVPALYHGYTFGGSQTSAGVNCGAAATECDWATNRGPTWSQQFPVSVSSPVIAWGQPTNVMTISRAAPFDFFSAYLGASYGSCPGTLPSMTVNAYRGTSLVNTSTVVLPCNTFALQTFNWTNINQIEFSATTPTASRMFDNILVSSQVSTIPEPATVALLGTGLLAVGAAARKRRKA